jgi:hypothetical protein
MKKKIRRSGRLGSAPSDLLIFFFPLLLSACGGATPPPQEPQQEAVHEDRKPVKPGLQVASELGTVDPAVVKRAFAAHNAEFERCQAKGVERLEVMNGGVKFFLRIGRDGSARYAYIADGDLGDRDTEKCLLDIVMGASWPKPDGGGEAEATYSMDLPLMGGRPPNDWNADKIAAALGKHGNAVDKCKEGVSGTFRVTMYVGEGGKVLSVGVAVPSKDGEEKSECIVKAMKGMHGLPTPGSWPAKVTFVL